MMINFWKIINIVAIIKQHRASVIKIFYILIIKIKFEKFYKMSLEYANLTIRIKKNIQIYSNI